MVKLFDLTLFNVNSDAAYRVYEVCYHLEVEQNILLDVQIHRLVEALHGHLSASEEIRGVDLLVCGCVTHSEIRITENRYDVHGLRFLVHADNDDSVSIRRLESILFHASRIHAKKHDVYISFYVYAGQIFFLDDLSILYSIGYIAHVLLYRGISRHTGQYDQEQYDDGYALPCLDAVEPVAEFLQRIVPVISIGSFDCLCILLTSHLAVLPFFQLRLYRLRLLLPIPQKAFSSAFSCVLSRLRALSSFRSTRSRIRCLRRISVCLF